MSTPGTPPQRPPLLAAIAALKVAKCIACIFLAAAALHLVRPEVAGQFGEWLESSAWATRYALVSRMITWLLGLGPRQFEWFGFVAIGYAILYAVQGIGLWLGKRWAEYLIIVETGLLVPVEIGEMMHRFSTLKFTVFVVNLLIVAYLVHRLRLPRGGSTTPSHRAA